jgi:type I restriction enzyme, S subunit
MKMRDRQHWPRKQLGEVLTVKHGFAFRSEFFGEEGSHIVVTPGNFNEEGGFKPKSGKEKYYTADAPSEFVLAKGDLIIAMTEQAEGLLGSSALVPVGDLYLHNQRIGLLKVTAPDLADKVFLYYLFNTQSVRLQIQATATGAKVRHTAPSRIEAVSVELPPRSIQERIAAVLSAYDSLIENNTRRIEILEEIARAIYREWFVEFRFPGHEEMPLVDSDVGPIPEGWSVEPIGHVVETLGGGTPSRGTAEYWDNGSINWFTPTDLTGANAMFMHGSATRITELGLAKSSAKLFRPGSVMMTSRATIGVVAITTVEAATNQGFITCLPNDRLCSYHLYFWLKANVDMISTLASGATFKEINKSTFRSIPIAVPSPPVEEAFRLTVDPVGELIDSLLRANRNLQTTRDLLLPRLISGEVDVSDLDIDIGDAAA